MASIQFTDGAGAATLTNGKAAPGDRFRGWQPDAVVVGPRHTALATGVPSVYEHRTDYVARFALEHIPASSLDTLLRLVRHLRRGNSVTVNTGDAASRSYTCYLAPSTEPQIAGPDPVFQEYTLSLTVLNASAANMLCIH